MGFFSDVGNFVSGAVETAVGVATTVGNAVVDTVDSTVGTVADGVFNVLDGTLGAVPFFGPFLKQVRNIATGVLWEVNPLAALDFIAALFGIRPEKRLKMRVIVQRQPAVNGGAPLVTPTAVSPFAQFAIDVFKDQANVRILPVGVFQYSSAFADKPSFSDEYVVTTEDPGNIETLDVKCGAEGWLQELPGGFETLITKYCFLGAWRRATGYGSPVVAFAVRSFSSGTTNGCSAGPFHGYVTVNFALNRARNTSPITSQQTRMAHELGHACNLWHFDDQNNLMNGSDAARREMTRWQIALLRASPHVTYF